MTETSLNPDGEPLQIETDVPEVLTPKELRLRAVVAAARFHGVDLDMSEFRGPPGEPYPSPASLVAWLREQGMVARGMRLAWRALFRFRDAAPVVLLLKDGTAGLVVGADVARDVVWLKSPTARDSEPPVAVDRLRLEQAWAGDVILVKRPFGQAEGEAPFTMGWIFSKVLEEKKFLTQISYASVVLSALSILPALIVMGTIDRVLEYNSMSTFVHARCDHDGT